MENEKVQAITVRSDVYLALATMVNAFILLPMIFNSLCLF